jgi:serine/threonine protein kinase/formylglycine-generating enzyme required for sulfatase activity
MISAPTIDIPRDFDGYHLLRPLGRGAMGEVWLCEDTLLERPVAIKFIAARDPSEAARQRFLVEARAIARLSHPCVLTIHRVGQVSGRPYLVYEYVEGQSLDLLPVPLPWRRVVDLGHDLARGLAMAHRAGVIHRDIKPANAILSKEGTVKLLDFGIARLLGPAPGHAHPAPAALAIAPAEAPARPEDALGRTAVARPSAKAESAQAGIEPTKSTDTPKNLFARTAIAKPMANALSIESPQDAPSAAQLASPAALHLTRPGSAVGTPLYMAPEIWRGEPATFASDVYSLGAVMYALCVGRPPHQASDVEALGDLVQRCDAQATCTAEPSVDPQLGAIVDRCLRRDPTERYEGAEEVRAALAQVLRGLRGEVVPEGNPYRGLRAFDATHRAVFFGRESEMRAVLERLASDPLVVVTGDSGVGKSSLCRAGIVPRLGDWLDAARSWSTVTLCPGPQPVAALIAAVAAELAVPEQRLMEALAEGAMAFGRELRRLSGPNRGLLVFVDQLEELATLADAAQGRAFAALLGGLAVPTPGLKLLASVRGDFLGRISAFPGLGDVLQRSLYFLRPLSRERLREVITGPAQRTGVVFESEALVQSLVDSSVDAAGGLPLLQFALMRLYDARDIDKKRIPEAALRALGGVAGALSLHADELLGHLPAGQRELARGQLLQLVTAERTRARKLCSDLTAPPPHQPQLGPALTATLDALVQGRLIAVLETPQGASCELAHEALLHGWKTLSEWLAADAGLSAVRERLSQARGEWQRLGRPREALWRAGQLRQATALDPAMLPQADGEFLRQSRRSEQLIRWRNRGLGAAVVAALLATWLGVRLQHRAQLNRQIAALVASAQRHGSGASDHRKRAESLERQALQLFDAREKDRAEALWQQARLARAEEAADASRASQELEPAVKLDPERGDVRSLFADSLYARALIAEQRHDLPARDELLHRLQLYDEDGQRQQAFAQPGQVQLAGLASDTTLILQHYAADDRGLLQPTAVALPLPWPKAGLSLPPGSYRLVARRPGFADMTLPFALGRGEKLVLALELPRTAQVPSGYAYVPAGRFLFGSGEEDSLRRGFLHTVPIHPVVTAAFLIARRETTFGDYLQYLSALPSEEREKRTPTVHVGGFEGALTLVQQADGLWRLTYKPTVRAYSAVQGQAIVYPGRKRAASHDWLKMPVVGLTAADAEAYAAWLAATGRLPGARLCTELEWERAARGGDDRSYPHGGQLRPEDANFDATHAKDPLAMGPDEVGSHPASRSPFGLDDMAGNVFEWTRNSVEPQGHAARGGSFYFDVNSARVAARETPEAAFRDVSVGIRVCADPRTP